MPTSYQRQTHFTAAIRWRGPDPTIQLETRHPGFATEADAVRFAGGDTEASASALFLRPEGIWLGLGTDGLVEYPYDYVVGWIRRSTEDRSFEMCDYRDVSRRPSSHGKYERAGYAILGPDGSPVREVIEFDNMPVLEVTGEKKGRLNAPWSQATRP